MGRPAKDMSEDKQPVGAVVGRATNEINEEEIDRNLIGSFPASDPPSWTLGVERDRQPAATIEEII